MTSFVDVAIPGVAGLLFSLWPRVAFFGSRVNPTEEKIRRTRYLGGCLLLIAAFYLLLKLVFHS